MPASPPYLDPDAYAVVEAAGRAPLAPAVVRARLVATGLPQPSGTTQPIGPRPQVAAAAALALTAAPAL